MRIQIRLQLDFGSAPFFCGTPFLHSVFCIHATFQQLWSEDLYARIHITCFSGSNIFPDPTPIFTDPNIILQFKHLDPQVNFFQAVQTCSVQCHSLGSFAPCPGTSSITFRWVNWSDFSDQKKCSSNSFQMWANPKHFSWIWPWFWFGTEHWCFL